MPSNRNGVQSVHRALDALELLGRDPHLSIRQLADAMALPVSTAHGLVSTLIQRGYVTRTQSGYALGIAAASLSLQWDPGASLSLILRRATEKLTAATGLASAGSVLAGNALLLLRYTPGTGPITVGGASGQWYEQPLSKSTGRVLVALGPRSRWDDHISRADGIEHDWSPARWRSELELIRERRIARRNPDDPGAEASIAVPVIGPRDRAVCAIGCSSPVFLARNLSDPAILNALTRTSAEISRDLGTSVDYNFDPDHTHPLKENDGLQAIN